VTVDDAITVVLLVDVEQQQLVSQSVARRVRWSIAAKSPTASVQAPALAPFASVLFAATQFVTRGANRRFR
jgi:hypothetical protein